MMKAIKFGAGAVLFGALVAACAGDDPAAPVSTTPGPSTVADCRTSWTFDDGQLGGVEVYVGGETLTKPADVRDFESAKALGADVLFSEARGNSIGVKVPLCPSGTADLTGKRISMRIYLAGPVQPEAKHYVKIRHLADQDILVYADLEVGKWNVVDAMVPADRDATAVAALDIDIRRNLVADWQGTVLIDDVRITP
jgi:hypothetical protein